MRKGIILAGGAGTRLYPLTLTASKQLQRVFDKPMIYYPLTTLMFAGIRDICVISTPEDLPRFEALMGDGKRWGITLCYREQPEPKGIAEAFLIAEDFIAGEPVTLILGDNIFYGSYEFDKIFPFFEEGAHIFAYRVKDHRRYGIVEFDGEGNVVSIEEKPDEPKSSWAVPGLYLYGPEVVEICRNLLPGVRGELEITDVNKEYLKRGRLRASIMGRGTAWLDTGTATSLHEASTFVQIIESRQGLKIGCPEELALRKGFIGFEEYAALVATLPDCEYADYLREIQREFKDRKKLWPPTR
ncbi:glucose-1-phosphate thymidylyltransferase [bacterium]|nr:MAG: glucose-1-phosphate thymidylyltransferase [bacterium]